MPTTMSPFSTRLSLYSDNGAQLDSNFRCLKTTARICFCRPVILRGQNPCMFQPIPGQCYAPLPPTHKQNTSIMDEAFPLFSARMHQVASLLGDQRASALTSNRSFIFHKGVLAKRRILLYLLTGLVNNHNYCHTTLTFTFFSFSPQCVGGTPFSSYKQLS